MLGIKSVHLSNIQILAGFLVSQSTLILLTQTVNIQELIDKGLTIAMSPVWLDDLLRKGISWFFDVVLCFVVAFTISVINFYLVARASIHYKVEVKRFNDAEIEMRSRSITINEEKRTPATAEEVMENLQSEEYQISRRLYFWSVFFLPYTPSRADHESKILRRKILSFLVPIIFQGGLYFIQVVDSENNNSYTPIYKTISLPRLNPSRLGVISMSLSSILFFLI